MEMRFGHGRYLLSGCAHIMGGEPSPPSWEWWGKNSDASGFLAHVKQRNRQQTVLQTRTKQEPGLALLPMFKVQSAPLPHCPPRASAGKPGNSDFASSSAFPSHVPPPIYCLLLGG